MDGATFQREGDIVTVRGGKPVRSIPITITEV
jgi:hypothetical protein